MYSGPDTEASETDLAEGEIVGGSERADASEFDVTAEAVRTTLRETGLFTSRGPHKLGFAHKTYGEYLAAKYLHNARLPRAQLRSLLFVPGEDPPRLIPQLHEVAAWLASFDREFFDRVVQTEPEVLLQSDVTARDQGTKALLIQSLLGRVERRELSWSQVRGLRPYLHRLRHEALAEQLRTAVTDEDRRGETRRLAIKIVEATDLKEMADVLADLALDRSLDPGLRETAAYSVVSLDVESACERMKPLALGEAGDDPRDQLRGCGLRATWPRFLTVDDLLRCLTPVKQSNFTGAYQMYLHGAAIAEHIADADLPQALEWAMAPGSHGRSHEPLSRLAGQLAYRALSHLDNESVRRALAKLIMRRLKAHIHDIFVDPRGRPRLGDNEQQPLELETDLRRLLLDALVTNSAINDLIYLIYCRFDFARPDDIEWILHRAAETEADEQGKWIELAGFIFRPLQPDHLEIWQRHKDTCDAVRAMLPWPEVVVLESPKALEMRRRHTEWEDHRRRMEELAARQERLDPPARERVRIVLNRCLNGEPELFLLLLEQLRLKDDDRDEVGLPETVQDHPGWQAADDKTRSQIVEAARRYLRDAALDPADPYQRDIQTIADRAPPLAVELLLNEDQAFLAALDAIRWQLIAPFLLIAPVGTAETRRRSAEYAYRRAPAAVRDAAIRLIERSRLAIDSRLVAALDTCLDDTLTSRVLACLRREECSREVFLPLLSWLVRSGSTEARTFAQSLVTPPRFDRDRVPR